jgi:hypothetical protein
MVRRFLVLFLMLSVISLGLPRFAFAAEQMGGADAASTMGHDCVCPPGHEMPASDDSDSCAKTLLCLADCLSAAQLAVSADILDAHACTATLTVPVWEITRAPLSSSFPPYRPPSL